MDVFLQQVLNGLTLGGIYGLVALGLTLVYGILHVPNFAHGGFYMIGAFVAFQAMVAWSWGYWAAMLVATSPRPSPPSESPSRTPNTRTSKRRSIP